MCVTTNLNSARVGVSFRAAHVQGLDECTETKEAYGKAMEIEPI
jgi:hypothetical protein